MQPRRLRFTVMGSEVAVAVMAVVIFLLGPATWPKLRVLSGPHGCQHALHSRPMKDGLPAAVCRK